jgi:hypothetical protein
MSPLLLLAGVVFIPNLLPSILLVFLVVFLPLRVLATTFRKARIPLGEWLATFLVAGTAATSNMAQLNAFADFSRKDPTLAAFLVMALSMLSTFAGSAWGWTRILRRAEERPWQRLSLLVQSWLVSPLIPCLLLALQLHELRGGPPLR